MPTAPSTSSTRAAPHVRRRGRSLVDVVNGSAYPGGSPPTSHSGWLASAAGIGCGHDSDVSPAWRSFATTCSKSGRVVSADSIDDVPTSSAMATLDERGGRTYEFDISGTSTYQAIFPTTSSHCTPDHSATCSRPDATRRRPGPARAGSAATHHQPGSQCGRRSSTTARSLVDAARAAVPPRARPQDERGGPRLPVAGRPTPARSPNGCCPEAVRPWSSSPGGRRRWRPRRATVVEVPAPEVEVDTAGASDAVHRRPARCVRHGRPARCRSDLTLARHRTRRSGA